MNEEFKAFENIKPDSELLEKTKQAVLEKKKSKNNTRGKIAYIAAIAAVLALVCGVALQPHMQFNVFESAKHFTDTVGVENGGDGEYTDSDGNIVEETGDVVLEASAPTAKEEIILEDGAEVIVDHSGSITKTEPAIGSTAIPPTGTAPEYSAGQLTAKQWNDNDNFAKWLDIVNGEAATFLPKWLIKTSDRIALKITSGQSAVSGATAQLIAKNGNVIIWTAVSDSKGNAYLFAGDANKDSLAKIVITDGSETKEINIDTWPNDTLNIELNSASEKIKNLDLMFAFDTTGSMGDELAYIHSEFKDIITRVSSENREVNTRIGLNFYRDKGDEYVVRDFPFETNVNKVLKNIGAQSAAGGGDFPEAVHEVLESAVNKAAWNMDSVKLMFLILDAPPHNEDAAQIAALVKSAAEKGIRIIPVAASGVDKNTEYLMRSMSVATGGTYVMLTDDSGIGSPHIDGSVGETKTYFLNDLIVHIIGEYLK